MEYMGRTLPLYRLLNHPTTSIHQKTKGRKHADIVFSLRRSCSSPFSSVQRGPEAATHQQTTQRIVHFLHTFPAIVRFSFSSRFPKLNWPCAETLFYNSNFWKHWMVWWCFIRVMRDPHLGKTSVSILNCHFVFCRRINNDFKGDHLDDGSSSARKWSRGTLATHWLATVANREISHFEGDGGGESANTWW